MNNTTTELGLLSIHDLTEMITRMGYEYNPVLTIIQNAFKKNGDVGVKEVFKLFTEIEIDNIRKGRYVIKPLRR